MTTPGTHSLPAPALQDATGVTVHDSLEAVGEQAWNALWRKSRSPSVFARYEWAEAWLAAFGDGYRVRIYTLRQNGQLAGLLPLAWPKDSGDVVLIGDWHADYAGLLTDSNCPEAFPTLLNAVCLDIPKAARLRLAEVRDDSLEAPELERLASVSGSQWIRDESTPCPRTELNPAQITAVINKSSLKRHDRKLRQQGEVTVTHDQDADAIIPRLGQFFDQHIARWSDTQTPSLFIDERNQVFYRELVKTLAQSGSMVFTEISLDGKPAAFHMGFLSEGDFLWYKPTFDPALSKLSPGEVLLRELFLWVGEQQLAGFDFTRGGEAFKLRFATSQRYVTTYVYHGSRLSMIKTRATRSIKRSLKSLLPGPMLAMLRKWRQKFNN